MKTKKTVIAALGGVLLVLAGAPAAARAQNGFRADEDQRVEQLRRKELAEMRELLRSLDEALTRIDAALERKVRLEIYDVRELLFRVTDRAGPSLLVPGDMSGLKTSKGAAGGVLMFDASEEGLETGIDADKLIEIIEAMLPEDAFDLEGCSLEVHRGQILLRAEDRIHALTEKVIASLLEANEPLVQLDVEFVRIPPELQAELGRGRGGRSILEAEQVERLRGSFGEEGGARLLESAVITSYGGQRTYLHHGRERAFVADFELSSGGTGMQVATVTDPIVDVLRTGLVLDVRPAVQESEVSLDVRFARTSLVAMDTTTQPQGQIETPRVVVDTVRTSAIVPRGGAVLLASGGRGKGTGGRGGGGVTRSDFTILIRPRVVGR